MSDGASIALSNVTVRFGDTVAVQRVSFRVSPGEVVAVVGGSGSGKTTALKTINRLVDPTEGTVHVGGEDVRTLAPATLRRRVGYCFQRIGLFPHLTVAENVGITPRLLGWPAERITERVDELLELVRLPARDYGERLPEALSGGQRQRVGVARALAAQPRVVLFDEPFGALDALTREDLQRELLSLRAEVGLTGVFVTHDILEALIVGDRIGVMRGGRLLQIDTPQRLLAAPADPYVETLLASPRRHATRLTELLPGP